MSIQLLTLSLGMRLMGRLRCGRAKAKDIAMYRPYAICIHDPSEMCEMEVKQSAICRRLLIPASFDSGAFFGGFCVFLTSAECQRKHTKECLSSAKGRKLRQKWNPSDFHCWRSFCLRNITQRFHFADRLWNVICAAHITTAERKKEEEKKLHFDPKSKRNLKKRRLHNKCAMALADTSKKRSSRAFFVLRINEPCKIFLSVVPWPVDWLSAGVQCTIRQAKRRQRKVRRRFCYVQQTKKELGLKWWICAPSQRLIVIKSAEKKTPKSCDAIRSYALCVQKTRLDKTALLCFLLLRRAFVDAKTLARCER